MLKKVHLTMHVERRGMDGDFLDSLLNGEEEDSFDPYVPLPETAAEEEAEEMDLFSEGRLRVFENTWSLTYAESEITGMEGSTTTVSFEASNPGLVTMLRSGSVNTVLVFQRGKRHTCAYQTPYMPFTVCVYARQVENRLMEEEKTLLLDYIVEIRGAQAEHCRMTLKIAEN